MTLSQFYTMFSIAKKTYNSKGSDVKLHSKINLTDKFCFRPKIV